MQVLIRRAQLIDPGQWSEPRVADVLIEDSGIVAVEPGISASGGLSIDANGLYMCPGLIDMHAHLIGLTSFSPKDVLTETIALRAMRAVADAERLVRAGFTTIRCAGSDLSPALKIAIAEGSVTGPRIFASNQIVAQTGGHADLHAVPTHVINHHVPFFRLTDGADDCRKAVREQVRAGADQIKICATGGVSYEYDDPHRREFTDDELHALIDEAHRMGRRVMAHAQGSAGIRAAVLAGADTIEHGIFLDDATIELLVEHKTVVVTTFTIMDVFVEHAEELGAGPGAIRKANEVHACYADNIRRAHAAGVTIAAGTDCFGGPVVGHGRNAKELELLVRLVGMTPAQALAAATTSAAIGLGKSGQIGTLAPGAAADLILTDVNPLIDVTPLQEERHIRMTVVGGRIAVAADTLVPRDLPYRPLRAT